MKLAQPETEKLVKAARRERKKRPRMVVHGQSLKRINPHAGKKLTSR